MEAQKNMAAVFVAVSAIALVVVAFIQSNKFLRQHAMGECIKAGYEEYSYPEDNTKSTTPNMAAYKDCMAQMGYTVTETK
ncbi:hypothetical protein A3D78_05655 [Candidatus Gottesmanbacteria bacterium RIFCSPHIGHO2_02_FULL_39_14]|uniref:Uncharacterized protein n=1 Tax=Candidatus Gottesmanbacteria bacterium RIFCSPHIGHO2_02_FULL_39_14 TaxID=1798383 RepID=A0A1F6A2M3_9BACT|nr:MAG: hypothetical protein A3D78_05655 [Candidatus Gottesmanbacteria bacterium RIFCSPHIGHO2_02_FULL_39_14]